MYSLRKPGSHYLKRLDYKIDIKIKIKKIEINQKNRILCTIML